MLGSALGFLLGGLIAEAFDIKAPFRLSLALFLVSCAYTAIFLPRIAPAGAKINDPDSAPGKKKSTALAQFFGPLFVFAPRKYIRRDGVVQTEYGAFLLAWGVFLGILATGECFLLSARWKTYTEDQAIFKPFSSSLRLMCLTSGQTITGG